MHRAWMPRSTETVWHRGPVVSPHDETSELLRRRVDAAFVAEMLRVSVVGALATEVPMIETVQKIADLRSPPR